MNQAYDEQTHPDSRQHSESYPSPLSAADPQQAQSTLQDMPRHEQARQLLRIAGKVARIGGWSVEKADGQTYWSDEICAILDYPPGVVPSLEEALAHYPPGYRETITEALTACLEEGTPFDLELQILTAAGRRIWARCRGEAQRDESGAIQRAHGAFQDITDWKEAERSLAQSKAHFRQVADALPIIVWSAEPDGTVDYINAPFDEYISVSEDELAEDGWFRFLHPDDVERCRAVWTEAVRTGRPYEIEFRIQRASDSSYRWHLVRGVPIRNESDDIIKWFGSALDIHDSKLLEEKATQLARRLSNTLESITDGFFALDDEWRLTYVNREAERMTRLPRVELLGKNVWEVFPDALEQGFHEKFMWAVAENQSVEFESFYPRCRKWLNLRVFPTPDGLAVYFQDITKQRQARESLRASEERFKIVARGTNDAIWDWNLVTDQVWWSEGLETLFGYPPEEVEPDSRSWTKRIHPQDRDWVLESIHDAVEQGGDNWQQEYRFLRRDGSVAHVLDRGFVIRNEAGAPVRMVGGMSDRTAHIEHEAERKRLEEQFFRAQRMESIGALAGGIAHDLNNVLSPILLSIQLLKQNAVTDSDVRRLELLEKSTKRGANMVRQLLTFARGVEGRRITMQIEEVVRDVDRLLRETLTKNIRIQLTIPQQPWPIKGDPTQLQQVLINLCVNARDAMPAGGDLVISIANLHLDEQFTNTSPEVKPGPYVRLMVADSGPGIPPEIRERIFDPFFTTKELGQGTGLGLATVQGIVKGHDGVIHVHSEEGQGSIFKIYLPAHPDSNAEAQQRQGEPLLRGNGEHILIVDDDLAVRTIGRQTLEAFGYRVLLEAQGAEALSTFSRRGADIAAVFTDLMMPVMDGFTLIQKLREQNEDVKIIATSGLSTKEIMHRVAAAGVEHFLPKPYTADALLCVLARALDRASVQ